MLRSIQSISNCWSWVELNTTTMSKTCNHWAKFTRTNINWLCSYCFLDWGMVTGYRHRWRWQFYCCSRSCYQVSFGFLTHMWAYISWSGIKMSILIEVSWILTWHSSWSMITFHLIFTYWLYSKVLDEDFLWCFQKKFYLTKPYTYKSLQHSTLPKIKIPSLHIVSIDYKTDFAIQGLCSSV
jgi:hypothetical protein